MPEWLQSKFVWLNVLGVLINVLQYAITNSFWPEYTTMFTMIIGILQIIVNAIAGTTQTSRIISMKNNGKCC